MVAPSIENLIRTAQEHPEQLNAEIDARISQRLSAGDCLRLFVDAAEKFSADWLEVCHLRGVVDDSLTHARRLYRDVLKKTEIAARHGRPRLYWLAKVLFSESRRQSLEYQILEAEIKIDALKSARTDLVKILKDSKINPSLETQQLLNQREISEQKSKVHAVDLQVAWEKYQSLFRQNAELRERAERIEIQKAVNDALVCEATGSSRTENPLRPLRKIDSPRMLLSRLPHVGFANRPRLMTTIEQSEYAATHAEKDLEKVREGLRLANQAAVEGQASSLSLEWLDYCRSIVSRYENLADRSVTHR